MSLEVQSMVLDAARDSEASPKEALHRLRSAVDKLPPIKRQELWERLAASALYGGGRIAEIRSSRITLGLHSVVAGAWCSNWHAYGGDRCRTLPAPSDCRISWCFVEPSCQAPHLSEISSRRRNGTPQLLAVRCATGGDRHDAAAPITMDETASRLFAKLSTLQERSHVHLRSVSCYAANNGTSSKEACNEDTCARVCLATHAHPTAMDGANAAESWRVWMPCTAFTARDRHTCDLYSFCRHESHECRVPTKAPDRTDPWWWNVRRMRRGCHTANNLVSFGGVADDVRNSFTWAMRSSVMAARWPDMMWSWIATWWSSDWQAFGTTTLAADETMLLVSPSNDEPSHVLSADVGCLSEESLVLGMKRTVDERTRVSSRLSSNDITKPMVAVVGQRADGRGADSRGKQTLTTSLFVGDTEFDAALAFETDVANLRRAVFAFRAVAVVSQRLVVRPCSDRFGRIYDGVEPPPSSKTTTTSRVAGWFARSVESAAIRGSMERCASVARTVLVQTHLRSYLYLRTDAAFLSTTTSPSNALGLQRLWDYTYDEQSAALVVPLRAWRIACLLLVTILAVDAFDHERGACSLFDACDRPLLLTASGHSAYVLLLLAFAIRAILRDVYNVALERDTGIRFLFVGIDAVTEQVLQQQQALGGVLGTDMYRVVSDRREAAPFCAGHETDSVQRRDCEDSLGAEFDIDLPLEPEEESTHNSMSAEAAALALGRVLPPDPETVVSLEHAPSLTEMYRREALVPTAGEPLLHLLHGEWLTKIDRFCHAACRTAEKKRIVNTLCGDIC